MKMRRIWVFLLLGMGAAHAGETYKWTDENGKVHFSDTKPAGGKTGAGSDNGESCQARWARYNENAACFEAYRQANGSVKAEAYRHCKEVKMPELCD